MNRLARLLRKANSITKDIPAEFWGELRTLNIREGEFMPLDLPSESWIFVEQGCLMLLSCHKHTWHCLDVYNEGTTRIVHSAGAADMEEGSYHIKAAEYSIVYCFTSDGREKLETIYPGFLQAQSMLHHHSFIHYFRRSRLFKFGQPE